MIFRCLDCMFQVFVLTALFLILHGESNPLLDNGGVHDNRTHVAYTLST